MNKKSIVQQLLQHKSDHPNLNYKLKAKTTAFTEKLFYTLFDAKTDVASNLDQLEQDFSILAKMACFNEKKSCETIWHVFIEKLPRILEKLNKDAHEILAKDPASSCLDEIYLTYPGFYAIAIYRLGHELFKLKMPIVPRMMSEYAKSLTGIEIHPGAIIGVPLFIDHGTGIVVGETVIIEDHVNIYQGVTLGALQVKKSMQNIKRHPTIQSHVTIYANATILGGETIIGENSTIGGNVWITESIPENSIVYHTYEAKVKAKKSKI